ncbi:MAG TPA: ABC transporter permease [Vicinamibacterales bacterium]|nr:ABC transporter permease [Vicinamibacterales bacterium]
MFFVPLRLALVALARNRLRTALTVLGIMVGIGAVICTVALGEGSAALIHQQMLNLGDNFIWIENGSANAGGVRTGARTIPKLTAADSAAIVDEVPDIVRCSPSVDSRIQLIRGNQNWNTTYRGVSPDYLLIKAWPVVEGASFSDFDVQTRAHVAILGRSVVAQLFGEDDPIGETFRMGPLLFTVVGVLKPRGTSTSGQDQDDTVFIPYTTAQSKIRGDVRTVDDIMCSATTPAAIKPAQDRISDLLRLRHALREDQPDDFNIRAPEDSIKLQEDSARTMEMMLSAIASVSLLVGGIGVMNIMLVSVAERTREIGLRMAIGAREGDVQAQFLVEALVLGLVGGAAGVIVGVAASQVFANAYGWPMVVSPKTIVVAVAFASSVGLVFGYYPARHAASLDPIEALRVE